MSNLTSVEQFRRRLKGGANHVLWSSHDIERIAKRFGLLQREIRTVIPPLPTKLIDQAGALKSIDGAAVDFTGTLSTGRVDRMGDTIAIDGWRLDEFRRNPIVLLNHQNESLPIGRSPAVWVSGAKLKGAITMAPGTDEIRKLIEGRFFTAISVGFLPISWEFSKDPSRPFGVDFKSQSLTEFSIVTVPANVDASIDPAPVAIGMGKSNVVSIDQSKCEAQLRREAEVARLRGGTRP